MIRTSVFILAMFCMGTPATAADQTQPTIRATGIGYPPRHLTGPRATLMARRAAEVLAVRNLGAKLQANQTTFRHNGTEYRQTNTTIRGYRYLPARNLPGGAVEVTVEWGPPTASPIQSVATQPAPSQAEVQRLRAQLQAERQAAQAQIEALRQEIAELNRQIAELRAAVADLTAELSEVTADREE